MENTKIMINKEKIGLIIKFSYVNFIIINNIYFNYYDFNENIFVLLSTIILEYTIFKCIFYLFYKNINGKGNNIIEALNHNVKYNYLNKEENDFSYLNNILSPIIIIRDEQFYYINNEAKQFINLDKDINFHKINIYDYLPQNFYTKGLLKTLSIKDICHNSSRNLYKNEKFIFKDNKIVYADLCISPLNLNHEEFVCISIKDNTLTIENKDLENQIKEIKIVNNEICEFFTNISHDLKTPINVIYSAIQVMNMNLNNKKMDCIEKYMPIIKQNCYRLLRLVNNIVDTNKIEAGCFKMKFKNNNIVNLIEDIVMSVSTYVQNNDMNIIFDTDTEEKIVACDKDMLERVILNLISNSVKYKKNGKGNIEVTVKDGKDKVVISVRDDGIGIPKSLHQNVFKRFVRLNKNEEKLTNSSSGIGLALVKSIVDMHSGNVFLKSEENKGTEMIIEIPVKIVEENYKDSEINNRSMGENKKIEFLEMYEHVI